MLMRAIMSNIFFTIIKLIFYLTHSDRACKDANVKTDNFVNKKAEKPFCNSLIFSLLKRVI